MPTRRGTSASLISRNPDNYFSFPYGATPAASKITLVEASDESDEDQTVFAEEPERMSAGDADGLPHLNGPRPGTEPSRSRLQTRFRRAKKSVISFLKGFNDFMTAPLWAAVASIVVACVQPLQYFLAVHAQPIKGSIASAGACSIPVTMIVLGAYFYRDDKAKPKTTKKSSKKLSYKQRFVVWWNTPKPESEPTPEGETKTIIVSILARMVVTPAVLLPLFYVFAKYDLHEMFDECVPSTFVCPLVLT